MLPVDILVPLHRHTHYGVFTYTQCYNPPGRGVYPCVVCMRSRPEDTEFKTSHEGSGALFSGSHGNRGGVKWEGEAVRALSLSYYTTIKSFFSPPKKEVAQTDMVNVWDHDRQSQTNFMFSLLLSSTVSNYKSTWFKKCVRNSCRNVETVQLGTRHS